MPLPLLFIHREYCSLWLGRLIDYYELPQVDWKNRDEFHPSSTVLSDAGALPSWCIARGKEEQNVFMDFEDYVFFSRCNARALFTLDDTDVQTVLKMSDEHPSSHPMSHVISSTMEWHGLEDVEPLQDAKDKGLAQASRSRLYIFYFSDPRSH
ncbi:hypothetical protein TRIUR3_22790 [Triticum urartu]|uniref:Uncharacterized protein n=1 Tax=Triticum urartu TaxID=4572 RepID=M7ZJ72_TRIUA|nr:hypothetical protein TRIUR3_22790 [Triticum urartu]